MIQMCFTIIFITFILLAPGVSRAAQISKPCPYVHIDSPTSVEFSPGELTFICGDPSIAEWSRLPLTQIKIHLKAILQQKGLLQVEFKIKDGILTATLGEQTLVKKIQVDAPVNLGLEEIFQKPLGKPLTPALLDEVESWFLERLLTQGYACPTVLVSADPQISEIQLTLTDLEQKKLLQVILLKDAPFNSAVLERYHGFQTGEIYNHEHMLLTSRRIISSGVLTNHSFIVKCQTDGVKADQVFSLGEPRLLSLGAGANTDLGPIFRIAWRNVRMGEGASTLGASLFLSIREQTLKLDSGWYFLKRPSRFHLSPVITVSREKESVYETLSSEVALLPSTSYDNRALGLWASLGPSYRYDRQYEGIAPVEADYYGLRGELKIEGHKHEYWKYYPREGHMLNANIFSTQNLFSATVLRIQTKHLFNFKKIVPPWFILGFRTKLNMTFTSLGADQSFILPTYFRHFLGGLSDVRGFSRKEIPGGSMGGLGAAYVGIEAASDALLPDKWRPFIFFDMGAMGEQSHQLDFPLYSSPGLGVRWESPIGAFRINLARGFVSQKFNAPYLVANSFQANLSLGEEF